MGSDLTGCDSVRVEECVIIYARVRPARAFPPSPAAVSTDIYIYGHDRRVNRSHRFFHLPAPTSSMKSPVPLTLIAVYVVALDAIDFFSCVVFC